MNEQRNLVPTASDGPTVQLHRDGMLAVVTLINTGKLNAMNRAMWCELREVFLMLHGMSDLRCVVVRGADGNFCAGGDIAEYPSFRFDVAALTHFHEVEVWGGLSAMLGCDIPLVCAIEGVCMGAGLEIASCCDLRLAGANTRFGAPIARLGFPMAPREAQLVAGAVGQTVARAILLAAATYSADEMLRCGFLTRTTAAGDAFSAAMEVAGRIADLAPLSARLNKQTLRSLSAPCAHQEAREVVDAYNYATQSEHIEGISAFLDKRKPQF